MENDVRFRALAARALRVTPVFSVSIPARGIRVVYALPLFHVRRRRRSDAQRGQGHDSGQWANRIGQGIEFDIAAAMPHYALREDGFERSW